MNTKPFPQASPSLPNSTFGQVSPNMQFQHTPVYAYVTDYPAASPLFSASMPMVMPSSFPAAPSWIMFNSNNYNPTEQMEELPPGMQSPKKHDDKKTQTSYELELRRKESQLSTRRRPSQDIRRQRTDRTEDFLERRYSHAPNQVRREVSLRDSMNERSGSFLNRGISEKTMTTLQMMLPVHPPNIIAMALDKHASLELQRTIAKAKAYRDFRTIEILFLQLLPEVIRLAKDEYANFVIQRILEVANHGLVDQMAEYVKLSVLDMAMHKYACRVLQRIVIYCGSKKREDFVKSIMMEAIELLQNKFGSYVLQTVIENTDSHVLGNLTTTHFEPAFYELSIDQYGSHIMQHVFRFYETKDKERLTELVLGRVIELSNDIHGNYVVQKMVYYGNTEIRSRVIEKILLHVPSLCCTKSGSNVLEKCLQNAAHEESKAIVEKVVENEETLKSIISDKYGNYVVQKMLKTLPYEQRIEFSQILMDYFEKLEEIPERNSFENFVYRAVVNARQKIQNTNARPKLSGA